MILAIHHAQITIPKGEEDKAREFYCGVLGLNEIPKPEELAGRGGFWLEIGDRQLHIGTEDKVADANSKAHVAYRVEDLEHWRSVLTKREVKVSDGIQVPGMRRFEFRDPFGNRVEFLELLNS
ncbi:MAG: glyoxalase [Acidobacteria bacterium]|nr:MAG: glyoxalase [Acidobacteriota bacterium]